MEISGSGASMRNYLINQYRIISSMTNGTKTNTESKIDMDL